MAEAAKDYRYEEQKNAHGDSRVCDIKNGEVKVHLRDAKSDEVYHIARVSRSVNDITKRATNNQAKDKFDCQRPAVYHAGVHVRDNPHRDENQRHQYNTIRKKAEGRSIIADVEK